MFRLKNCAAFAVCATLVLLSACSQSGAVPSGVSPSSQSDAAATAVKPVNTKVDTKSVLKNLNTDVVIGSTVDPQNGDSRRHICLD